MILHSAFLPQEFGHGSIHFRFIHARLRAHSVLATHSGLHPGGEPTYSAKQVQTACPLFSRHILFGPHGDGWQGLLMSDESSIAIK